MISELELVWYRRKLFWIGVVGFGLVVPLGISTLIMTLGDATGEDRWISASLLIQLFNGLIGLIVGATMGGVEHRNGMSRYVALTGTSRPVHALRRLAGAVVVWAAVMSFASLVALLMMLAANGWPDIEHPLRIWLAGALPGFVYVVGGFGLARLVGSPGIAIAILLGALFVLESVLLAVPKVGPVWAEISMPVAFLETLARAYGDTDAGGGEPFVQGAVQSTAVILGWMAGLFGVGLVVDLRRDL